MLVARINVLFGLFQHQKSSTLACLVPVMPNIIRWTQIAVNEKHEDMIDCMIRILTTIGRNPPSEFSCYVSELLDLQLKSDQCQDLYRKHTSCNSYLFFCIGYRYVQTSNNLKITK